MHRFACAIVGMQFVAAGSLTITYSGHHHSRVASGNALDITWTTGIVHDAIEMHHEVGLVDPGRGAHSDGEVLPQRLCGVWSDPSACRAGQPKKRQCEETRQAKRTANKHGVDWQQVG